MKKLTEILTDLKQGKISSDYAENQILDLFDISKLFIAEEGNNKLIVPESMLKQSELRILVDKLNKNGFKLGSGHDGLEIHKKKFNNSEFYYQLSLTPYIGHSDQCVIFYKFK